jgi:polysaccharide deacetylase 2 family uncharacterized protein YibQ
MTDDDFVDYGFEEESVVNSKANRVSLKDFLQAYVSVAKKNGNSVDVANMLGISPQGVRQRVGKLILQGIKLPKLGNICRKQQSSVS